MSLNGTLDYISNGEEWSDFEELNDESDSNLEAEPENHISSDDSESTTESSDEDKPLINATGQNVIDFNNNAESSDDESLTRKITKDPIPLTNPEDVHNWSWKKDYIGDTNINFK